MKKTFIVLMLFCYTFFFSILLFAGPGMHGFKTIANGNFVLNEYTTLSANAMAGANTIFVANSGLNVNMRFPGNLLAGELLLIIQMQGATINTTDTNSVNWGTLTNLNNAGNFELIEVVAVPNSTTIQLATPLMNSYTVSGKVQVIRVPRYTQFVLDSTGSVTSVPWDGSTGGVVVLEVDQDAILRGLIDVTAKGFRGGVIDSISDNPGNHLKYSSKLKGAGAEKGEGIAGGAILFDIAGGRYGRGAAANGGGGGNSHNCGGGGGANGSNGLTWNGQGIPDTIGGLPINRWALAWNLESNGFAANLSNGGGRGGYSWSNKNRDAFSEGPGQSSWGGDSRFNCGGMGGRPVTFSRNRIFIGGGGGAGDGNDGYQTNGANGGGLVYFLIKGNLLGTGTINANGGDAVASLGKDAAGGGGGGGTIFLNVLGQINSNISINAKGGNGGSQLIGLVNEAEGPGGGGGGGAVFLSKSSSLTINVSGGKNGSTNSSATTEFIPNGATSGASGFIDFSATLPVSMIDFSAESINHSIIVRWSTASETNNNYFQLEKSPDGLLFEPMATLSGSGSSSILYSYTVLDTTPFSGINYYRLKQADFDGRTRFYGPIVCRFSDRKNSFHMIGIAPLPFIDEILLEFSSDDRQLLEVSIVDISGRSILHEQIISHLGFNKVYFNNLSEVPSGIYFLKIHTVEELLTTIRLIK